MAVVKLDSFAAISSGWFLHSFGTLMERSSNVLVLEELPQASMSHPFLSLTRGREMEGAGRTWGNSIVQVGRQRWGSRGPTPWVLKARPAMKLDEVQWYATQASFEYFWGHGCHTTAGQSLPALNQSPCQNSFHRSHWEFTFRPRLALVLLLCTSEDCLIPSSVFEGISEIPRALPTLSLLISREE